MNHRLNTALIFNPTTPPPFPSHSGMLARHTGHLSKLGGQDEPFINDTRQTHFGPESSPSPPLHAPLAIPALTALKRHEPHAMCPQGVRVAFVGGQKQMGQQYDDSGWISSCADLDEPARGCGISVALE
jgi:hypothetical protein